MLICGKRAEHLAGILQLIIVFSKVVLLPYVLLSTVEFKALVAVWCLKVWPGNF